MRSVFFCLLACMANAVNAEDFFCHESKQSALNAERAQYAVWIKETSSITDGRVVRGYDYAKNVIVSVMSRNPNSSSQFLPIKTFKAIAKSADVMYHIDAKSVGVRISIYMDELDQTSVKLPRMKKSIQMTCTGTEHS